jgi:hypothetical protein
VGQTRPDLPKPPTFADVQRRLRELTRMAVALNVDVSYSVTLYRDRPQQLEEMVDFFMSMPDATFLFVARAKDPLTSHHVAIDDPSDSSSIVSTRGIEQVQRLFRETYGIEPYAYIPAVNAQGREVRPPIWISYFLPVSYRGGRLRRILPVQTTDLDRSVMYLPRLYRGHFIHKTNQKPLLTAARLLLNSISSRRVGSLASFLVDTWRSGADLRHKMVVYDDGTFLDDAGERVVCEYCPTAIVRKGRLVKCCDSINDDLERQASEPKQEGIRA